MINIKFDKYTIYGLLAIVLWSTSVALVRSISEKAGPITSGAFVYIISGFLLFFVFLRKRGSFKQICSLPPLYLFGCGVLFVINTITFYISIGSANNHIQTLEVSMINYLWPFLSIIFSLIFLKKKAKVSLIPSSLIALSGIVLVLTSRIVTTWSSFVSNIMTNPSAYAFAAVAAFSWALYSNLTRRWGEKCSVGGVPIFILFSGCGLLCLRLFYAETITFSYRLLIEVLVLSFATAAAYALWDESMRKGDVIVVMIFSYMTPLLSTFMACFYLGYVPNTTFWIGVICVCVGSLLSKYSIKN